MSLRLRVSIFAQTLIETLLHPLSDSTLIIKDGKIVEVKRVNNHKPDNPGGGKAEKTPSSG